MAPAEPEPPEPEPLRNPWATDMASPSGTDRAIFLIDAHLLDTLLGAIALGVGRAALVHCLPQRPAAELAARVLERHGIVSELLAVSERVGPADAEAVLDQLGSQWHLHHTGGPDGLAALLVRESARRGAPPADASVLDQERRELRFDDGSSLLLDSCLAPGQITLDDVLELALLRREQSDRHRPTPEEVLAAAQWRLGHEHVFPTLEALTGEELHATLPPVLSRHLTDPRGDGRWWADYLRGRWMEDFVGLMLTRAAGHLGIHAEVEAAVTLRLGSTRLELDVMALIGHRPHVISCTSSPNGQLARQKAYEAERRAWQLAGPVARPALVTTLGPDSTPKSSTIQAIFDEPLEMHRSTDLRLFSRPEVGGWLNALDSERPAASLERWLTAGLGRDGVVDRRRRPRA